MIKRRRQRKEMLPKNMFKEIMYENGGPPILEQCGSCVHAKAEYFDPGEICPLQREVKTIRIDCRAGHDCWQEGACKDYEKGLPELQIVLLH